MSPLLDLLPDDHGVYSAAGTAAPRSGERLPDIEALADELLGQPYATTNCWELTQYLYSRGWGLTFDPDQDHAGALVNEVWWHEDGTDARNLLQRWDCVIFRLRGVTTQHLGVMLDHQRFVHTSAAHGVQLGSIQRWYSRLIQVARLRHLPPPMPSAPVQPSAVPVSSPGVQTVMVISPLRGPYGQLRTLRATRPAGATVATYLPPREALTHVTVNGAVVPRAHYDCYQLRDGDEVWCYPQWQDPVTGSILLYAGLSIAIGLATATLSHFLFRPKPLLLQPQNTMTQPEERTFSFEGIRTAVGPGAIIPVIYGTHRVGGQLLAASVDPAHFVYNQGVPGAAGGHPITLVWGGDGTIRIVVQALGHGFSTGDMVAIQGVQGKTGTNSTWQIEVLDGNIFALQGSEFTDAAAYTSGGTVWRVQGGNNNIQRAVAISPTLSLLLALGEGEIDAVLTDTIKINDQPITNFPGVELFTRLGTADQLAIAELGETRNTFADGRPIPSDVSLQYTMQAPATGFVLNIGFLEGLLNVTEQGEKVDNIAYLQYRWSVSGTGNWSNWVTVPVAADRAAPVRIGLRQDHLAQAIYQLEIIARGGGADGTVSAIFTNELQAHWRSTLESVTEIVGGTNSYPNTALLGIRALATEQLQGGLPNVTVKVRGLKVRQGSFAAPKTWTDNPAWCVMDFLTNARYGQGLSDGEIDLLGFATYAAECDSLIDGEPRHRLNVVIDREERLQPLLLTLMGGSRGLLLKSGALWTPRPTRTETPVALLSWASVTNVTLTYTRDVDDINVMEARFANEETDYAQDVMTWPPVASWPAVVHKHSIDLRGVTKPSRVQRALQYELNRRRFETLLLEMDCAADAMPLQLHDLFRFAHPMPGWATSGRIQAGSTTTVVLLDMPVSIAVGGSYLLYVRHEDGTIEARPVINAVLGEVWTVMLATPLSQTPIPRTSLWVFGTAATDGSMRTFRVTSLQRKTDATVHLEAVIHNPTIYDDPTASPLSPITSLFNPLGPPPPIVALVLSEVTRIQTSGTSLRVVNLSWDVGGLGPGYAPYGGAMIFRRTVTGSGTAGQVVAGAYEFGSLQDPSDPNINFVPLTQVRGHVLDFDDYTVATGATYVYRVVPISVRGVPNNVGAREGVIHVSGPTTPGFFPGTVQGLRLLGKAVGDWVFEGRDIHFAWDPVGQSPLFSATFFIQDYIVEIWAPEQEYLMHRTVVPIGAPGATIVWTYTYAQNQHDNIAAGFAGARREVQILVWARTNTGRVSLDPATITVINPPPDMSSIVPEAKGLFAAALIEWNQFAEPLDFDHYVIYLDTVNPPRAIYQDVPVPFGGPGTSFRKIFASDLSPNVQYWVQIEPYDTFGAGIKSQVNTFTPVALTADFIDTTPPAVPTGLSLSTGTTTQPDGSTVSWVEASWTANSEQDLAGYELHVTVDPLTVPTIFFVGPGDHTYRIEPIAGGVTVHVKLLAFDGFHNQSAYTDEATITTGADTTPPGAPSGLVAQGSVSAIALLWTPPSDLDYRTTEVWASTTNARATASNVGSGEYSFVHAGLTTEATWYYWVRAVDRSGNAGPYHPTSATGGVSAMVAAIVPGEIDTTPPAVPTGLALSTGTATNPDGTTLTWLRATWNANAEGDLGGYILHVTFGANPAPTLVEVERNATSVQLDVVPGNVTAVAKILAFDRVRNQSAYSSTASLTTAADTTGPAVPTGITVIPSFRAIALLWTPPADGDYAYAEVWASQTNSRATATLRGTGIHSFVHPGLASGATWYYWLRSIDRSGNASSYTPGDTAGLTTTTVLTTTGDIGALSITETQIATDAITTPKIAANAVTANEVTTGELITLGAQIRDAIITNGHITTLSASKITTGELSASTIIHVGAVVGGSALQLHGSGRYLAVYDEAATLRILLGKVGAGGTTYGLYVWNDAGQLMWDLSTGAQTTGIANQAITAAKIAANIIEAGHLRTDTAVITQGAQIANALIGDAHITTLTASKITTGTLSASTIINVGAVVGPGAIQLNGTQRLIAVFDEAGVTRALLGKLGATGIDYGLQLFNQHGQLMWTFGTGATEQGVTDSAITASKIRAGVIHAGHMRTDTLVVTTAAQIANALIDFAHIKEAAVRTIHIADAQVTDAKIATLTANKITTGTLTGQAIFLAGGAGTFYLDGSNQHLATFDQFGVLRTLLGRLGGGAQEYGLRIWNAAGQLMWDFNGGAQQAGIDTNAVSTVKIVPMAVTQQVAAFQTTAILYINQTVQLAFVILDDVKVGDQILLRCTLRADLTSGGFNVSITIREDAMAGQALIFNSNSAPYTCPLTAEYVYTAQVPFAQKAFVVQLDVAGTVTVDNVVFSGLRRSR